MSHRYSKLQIALTKFYRQFFPVPKSPWTKGKVDDICKIQLVPPEILESFFEQALKTIGREGDYLEFGVFNGSSIGSMALTAKRLNKSMRLFGFDAFEGLPPGAEKEDDGVWEKGFYACSYEAMRNCLKRRDIDPDSITWVKGWYHETLTPELAKQHNFDPAIVFIDCDTYSSSKTVLDFLAPLITKPTILCFDDWKLNDLDVKEMGEYKAFNEFLDEQRFEAKEIKSYNRKSKTFILRTRSNNN